MVDETLASRADVEASLGRDLTPQEVLRVGSILAKASDDFRRRSGQLFTPGESHVRVLVDRGRAYLRQAPVNEVVEVTDDDDNVISASDYKVRGQWLYLDNDCRRFIWVRYTHGSETVPDVVKVAIADTTAKVFNISPEALSGVTQFSETTGPFTEARSFAAWAQGGQTMLSPYDIDLADSFRVKVRRSILTNRETFPYNRGNFPYSIGGYPWRP